MIFATKLTCLSTCLTLIFPAAHTLAEPPPSKAAKDEDIHNVLEYQFGDDQVSGDLTAPLGEVLHVRAKRPKQSLVRARGSFVDKLVHSVENF